MKRGLDETIYWLEIIKDEELVKPELLEGLLKENEDLMKLIVSSIKTFRVKLNNDKKWKNLLLKL